MLRILGRPQPPFFHSHNKGCSTTNYSPKNYRQKKICQEIYFQKSYPRIILIIVLLLLHRVLGSPWWSTWSTAAWSWWSPSARRLSHHQSQVVRVLFDLFWLVFLHFQDFPTLWVISSLPSPAGDRLPDIEHYAHQSIDHTKDIVVEAQRQHWNISHPTPGRRWCCWPPTCGSSRWPSPTTSCCPAGWSLFDPAVGHQLHEKYFKIKQIWLKLSTDLSRSTKIQLITQLCFLMTYCVFQKKIFWSCLGKKLNFQRC